jgi:lipopolysaccharide/colanic/teichoic acid biosynthesis glycosyltransferase
MLKRMFDVSIALMALILMLPIFILVAYKVKKNFGAPVLFRQARSGLDGKTFEIIKFRTMSDDKDSEGNLLPDEYRLTDFGKQLRASSFDELPQLWNVLKGDMSIVGPRPQLIEYLPLYSEEQFKRHLVKPGITGYAQINGRNNISWEKRFELDIWYVNNQSMWLDIQILFKTVGLVIKKQGICAEGEATMSRFTGNKQRRYKVINANVRRSLLRYRRLNRHFSERDIDI